MPHVARPVIRAVRTNSFVSLNFRTMSTYKVRRFAPLDPEAISEFHAPKLEGIIFDVDGTLCEPQNYMFKEMRDALEITKEQDILEHVHSLPPGDQDIAMDKIKDIERRAMKDQKPQPGLVDLMKYLQNRKIQKAICTRNFDLPIDHLLKKFLPEHKFDPIITRAFKPPKPDPAGINHIADSWGLSSASNCIMVGDSIDDMTAGHRAGAATVLLVNPANEHLTYHDHTDLVVSRLDELIEILEDGFVGREEFSEDEDEPPPPTNGHGEQRGRRRKRGFSARIGPSRVVEIIKSIGPGHSS